MKDICPLQSEADYDWALQEIDQYFETEPELGSPEGARFERLALVTGEYEAQHYPM